MKTPDKIYINKYMLRRGMLYPAQKPADEPEFEYIRKDALLEWANSEIIKINSLPDGQDDLENFGRRSSIIKLIDKINSL